MADRIQRAIGKPFRIGGHELVVSASIGISMNELGSGPAELMRNADIAMYHAKREGPARSAVFNSSMHSRVVSQVQLESQLRRVIDERRLRVFYQPIIELETGRLSGFEALARWPEGEPQVPPLEFIALAEAVGLIGALGRLVLNEACATLTDWRRGASSTAI